MRQRANIEDVCGSEVDVRKVIEGDCNGGPRVRATSRISSGGFPPLQEATISKYQDRGCLVPMTGIVK